MAGIAFAVILSPSKKQYMPVKKQDPKLVAAKQRSEVSYIAKRHKVRTADVKKACMIAGRSRAAVYELLRNWGYTIKTKSCPTGRP